MTYTFGQNLQQASNDRNATAAADVFGARAAIEAQYKSTAPAQGLKHRMS